MAESTEEIRMHEEGAAAPEHEDPTDLAEELIYHVQPDQPEFTVKLPNEFASAAAELPESEASDAADHITDSLSSEDMDSTAAVVMQVSQGIKYTPASLDRQQDAWAGPAADALRKGYWFKLIESGTAGAYFIVNPAALRHAEGRYLINTDPAEIRKFNKEQAFANKRAYEDQFKDDLDAPDYMLGVFKPEGEEAFKKGNPHFRQKVKKAFHLTAGRLVRGTVLDQRGAVSERTAYDISQIMLKVLKALHPKWETRFAGLNLDEIVAPCVRLKKTKIAGVGKSDDAEDSSSSSTSFYGDTGHRKGALIKWIEGEDLADYYDCGQLYDVKTDGERVAAQIKYPDLRFRQAVEKPTVAEDAMGVAEPIAHGKAGMPRILFELCLILDFITGNHDGHGENFKVALNEDTGAIEGVYRLDNGWAFAPDLPRANHLFDKRNQYRWVSMDQLCAGNFSKPARALIQELNSTPADGSPSIKQAIIDIVFENFRHIDDESERSAYKRAKRVADRMNMLDLAANVDKMPIHQIAKLKSRRDVRRYLAVKSSLAVDIMTGIAFIGICMSAGVLLFGFNLTVIGPIALAATLLSIPAIISSHTDHKKALKPINRFFGFFLPTDKIGKVTFSVLSAMMLATAIAILYGAQTALNPLIAGGGVFGAAFQNLGVDVTVPLVIGVAVAGVLAANLISQFVSYVFESGVREVKHQHHKAKMRKRTPEDIKNNILTKGRFLGRGQVPYLETKEERKQRKAEKRAAKAEVKAQRRST